MDTRISCIIPAYNEEKAIKKTLENILPLLGSEIYEIIVINDHSSDQTKKILKTLQPHQHLNIHHNTKNLGKSKTVAHGVSLAQGTHILLLDADLINLTTQNIKDLISPVKLKRSEATFAFIKNAWPLRPFKKIDYCSGQRVLPLSLIQKHLTKIGTLPSYGLEVFINKLLIQANTSLQIVHRNNVENDFHQNKDGRAKGRIKNLKIWRDILCISGGIIAVYKMNFQLEKLLISPSKNLPLQS